MPRKILILTLLVITLAACSPASTLASAPPPVTPPSAPPPAYCSVASQDDPAGQAGMFPPPDIKDWSEGPDDAAATLIVYNAFQCEYCAGVDDVISRLHAAFPDDLRLVFRHYPLPDMDKSVMAARAAEAAGLQGQFFAMKNTLYRAQPEWSSLTPEEFAAWLVDHAAGLGLDPQRFEQDLQSGATLEAVRASADAAAALGVPGVPFILINGSIYQGPRDYQAMETVVRLTMLGTRQFDDCPPQVIDPQKTYLATLKTEKGDIVIELYPHIAPFAANSFVHLAQQGFYDGVSFHRVLPDFIAQTGDPSGTGLGNAGYIFTDEINPNISFDQPGRVAMASVAPDTNGSQFFITHRSLPELNGKYTIFGQVVAGLDVLAALTPRDPSQGAGLPEGDKIMQVVIEER